MRGSYSAHPDVETEPVIVRPKREQKIHVNTGRRVIVLGGSVYPPLTEEERVRVALEIEKMFGPNVEPGFLHKHSSRKLFTIN